MHRLILMMVSLLLASACSARAESQGNVEDPLPVGGGPAADLAAPADSEAAPDRHALRVDRVRPVMTRYLHSSLPGASKFSQR